MNYNLLHNFILNYKDIFEEGMEKLVLAEDISNIDISSDKLEEKKKRRRLKAQKNVFSSSDEGRICFMLKMKIITIKIYDKLLSNSCLFIKKFQSLYPIKSYIFANPYKTIL